MSVKRFSGGYFPAIYWLCYILHQFWSIRLLTQTTQYSRYRFFCNEIVKNLFLLQLRRLEEDQSAVSLLFLWVVGQKLSFAHYFIALVDSRTAIAGAIIGLLLVFFFISSSRFLLRPYDVTTTSNLPFVQLSCNSNWSKCVTSFFVLCGAGFCVHSRD